MFVRYLSFDDFSVPDAPPARISGGRYFDPTWQMVEDAILSLDNNNRCLVIIADREDFSAGNSLGFGGGTLDDLYCCTAYLDGREAYLIDPQRSSAGRCTVMLGEPMELSNSRLVSRAAALHAAEVFFVTGKLAQDLTWTALK